MESKNDDTSIIEEIPQENIDNLSIVSVSDLVTDSSSSTSQYNNDIPIETTSPPQPPPLPIYFDTLVLSGGSAKGMLTLGALQYAYDNYLLKNLQIYIGTSSGAMICYLLIIGYTPIEIMVYICTHQLLEKIQNFNIVAMLQGRGASSFNTIQETLEKMTIQKIGYLPTIKDLYDKYGKTFICVTHNLTDCCTEYIKHDTHGSMPCITALRLSANLPLVFEHYKYGKSFYVDGGISDNFAIDIGDRLGKKILGITLTSEGQEGTENIDMNAIELIYKLIFIPISLTVEYKIKQASEKCKIINLKYQKLKFF
jgi:predicted acylesterase/phospholipase RssA